MRSTRDGRITYRTMETLRRLPLLFLLLACSGSPEPETTSEDESPSRMRAGPPAPGPETEAETMARETMAAAPAEAEPEPSAEPAREVAAPSADAAPLPVAIGQWVRYRVTWREGARSGTEYRVVDREDDTWWIEMSDRRGRQTRHVRMRVRPGTGGRSHELLSLTFKTGSEVREIPSRLLGMHQGQMQTWLAMLFPMDWEGRPQEDVTVRAGLFHGSFRGEQTLDFNGQQVTAEVWHHPEVPLTGMVKFVDRASGGHTLELDAFGTEGARSAF
ncbi:MAG: hypothetical protein AAGE52_05350 [Myxococcota bacterium]